MIVPLHVTPSFVCHQFGNTPLHTACNYGWTDTAVALALAGADKEAKDNVSIEAACL